MISTRWAPCPVCFPASMVLLLFASCLLAGHVTANETRQQMVPNANVSQDSLPRTQLEDPNQPPESEYARLVQEPSGQAILAERIDVSSGDLLLASVECTGRLLFGQSPRLFSPPDYEPSSQVLLEEDAGRGARFGYDKTVFFFILDRLFCYGTDREYKWSYSFAESWDSTRLRYAPYAYYFYTNDMFPLETGGVLVHSLANGMLVSLDEHGAVSWNLDLTGPELHLGADSRIAGVFEADEALIVVAEQSGDGGGTRIVIAVLRDGTLKAMAELEGLFASLAVCQLSNSDLAIGSGERVYIIDERLNARETIHVPGVVFSIAADSQGLLAGIIGRGGKLTQVVRISDNEIETLTQLAREDGRQAWLGDITVDEEGSIYFAYVDNSVVQMDRDGSVLGEYIAPSECLYEDYFVGAGGNVLCIDKESRVWILTRQDAERWTKE